MPVPLPFTFQKIGPVPRFPWQPERQTRGLLSSNRDLARSQRQRGGGGDPRVGGETDDLPGEGAENGERQWGWGLTVI